MYVHVQMHQFECLFLVIIFQSWLLIRGRFNFLKWSLNTEISADGRKIGVAQLLIIIYIPLPCNILRWFGFFFIFQAIFKAESDLDAWWRFKGSKKVEFNTATHLPPPIIFCSYRPKLRLCSLPKALCPRFLFRARNKPYEATWK